MLISVVKGENFLETDLLLGTSVGLYSVGVHSQCSVGVHNQSGKINKFKLLDGVHNQWQNQQIQTFFQVCGCVG